MGDDEQDKEERGRTSEAQKSPSAAALLLMGVLASPLSTGDAVSAVNNLPGSRIAPALTQPVRKSLQDGTPDKKRRDEINARILDRARTDFGEMVPLTATAYARQLQQMQDDINAYLARNNYKAYENRTAIVLNPEEFTALRAIGMTDFDAVKKMLERQGVTAGNQSVRDIVAGIGSDRPTPLGSKFGVAGFFTQSAKVKENAGTGPNGENVWVVVPMSNNVSPNDVPGLSYSDNIDFINRHEAWHVKDSRYDMTKFSREVEEAASVGWAPEFLGASAEGREAYAMIYRREALADVGALGDMIRDRKLTSFKAIDAVIDWREGNYEDEMHGSGPVLRGLKREIEKLGGGNLKAGFTKFQAMPEAETQEFYYKVVEKYGISPDVVKKAAEYDNASDGDKERMRAQAVKDPLTKKALEFLSSMKVRERPEEIKEDERARKEIDDYRPGKDLLRKAVAQPGKLITPASLMAAHRLMEDELREKAQKDPKNPVYPLKMAKLQRVFINMVMNTDYYEMNKLWVNKDVTKELPWLAEQPSPPVAAGANRKTTTPKVGGP
jgi:hypothetical protein